MRFSQTAKCDLKTFQRLCFPNLVCSYIDIAPFAFCVFVSLRVFETSCYFYALINREITIDILL